MSGKRTAAIILFILSLAFYVATMCPSVYTMDCGELIMAAYRLHVAHATGYPLFCLLGKLFTLLVPVGTIAWRMNLMNAMIGALAVTVGSMPYFTNRWSTASAPMSSLRASQNGRSTSAAGAET